MSGTSPAARSSPGTTPFAHDTWIDPEERCYPHGGFHRRARCLWRGGHRLVRAGLPDTFFTIPARLRHRGQTVRGFLSVGEDGALHFTEESSQ